MLIAKALFLGQRIIPMTILNKFLNKVMKMKKFFISPLLTAKLIHKKRKTKQATHITGFWFKKSITVSGTAFEKTKISLR